MTIEVSERIGELWGHGELYMVFLMAQMSMDEAQDSKVCPTDFLLIAKKKMSLYNEDFYCYHPNQIIANMDHYDIPSYLV